MSDSISCSVAPSQAPRLGEATLREEAEEIGGVLQSLPRNRFIDWGKILQRDQLAITEDPMNAFACVLSMINDAFGFAADDLTRWHIAQVGLYHIYPTFSLDSAYGSQKGWEITESVDFFYGLLCDAYLSRLRYEDSFVQVFYWDYMAHCLQFGNKNLAPGYLPEIVKKTALLTLESLSTPVAVLESILNLGVPNFTREEAHQALQQLGRLNRLSFDLAHQLILQFPELATEFTNNFAWEEVPLAALLNQPDYYAGISQNQQMILPKAPFRVGMEIEIPKRGKIQYVGKNSRLSREIFNTSQKVMTLTQSSAVVDEEMRFVVAEITNGDSGILLTPENILECYQILKKLAFHPHAGEVHSLHVHLDQPKDEKLRVLRNRGYQGSYPDLMLDFFKPKVLETMETKGLFVPLDLAGSKDLLSIFCLGELPQNHRFFSFTRYLDQILVTEALKTWKREEAIEELLNSTDFMARLQQLNQKHPGAVFQLQEDVVHGFHNREIGADLGAAALLTLVHESHPVLIPNILRLQAQEAIPLFSPEFWMKISCELSDMQLKEEPKYEVIPLLASVKVPKIETPGQLITFLSGLSGEEEEHLSSCAVEFGKMLPSFAYDRGFFTLLGNSNIRYMELIEVVVGRISDKVPETELQYLYEKTGWKDKLHKSCLSNLLDKDTLDYIAKPKSLDDLIWLNENLSPFLLKVLLDVMWIEFDELVVEEFIPQIFTEKVLPLHPDLQKQFARKVPEGSVLFDDLWTLYAESSTSLSEDLERILGSALKLLDTEDERVFEFLKNQMLNPQVQEIFACAFTVSPLTPARKKLLLSYKINFGAKLEIMHKTPGLFVLETNEILATIKAATSSPDAVKNQHNLAILFEMIDWSHVPTEEWDDFFLKLEKLVTFGEEGRARINGWHQTADREKPAIIAAPSLIKARINAFANKEITMDQLLGLESWTGE